ncbi:hypothetical protein Lser_V15G00244 [Lactuca serriola]
METHSNVLWSIRYIAAAKETIMVTIEKKRHAIPKINLVGKDIRKSFSAYLAVRIPKNINTEVDDAKRDSPFDIIKIMNVFLSVYNMMGRPDLSLVPPGMVKAVVNMTAAIRVPTIILDPAVFFIHFSPSFARSLCSSVNNVLGFQLFSFN